MPKASLKIAGQSYDRWESVRFNASLESLAWECVFEFSEQWEEGGTTTIGKAFPFQEGAECTISLDGDEVIIGEVAEISTGYGADSHSIGVYCRSRTGSLVDCSAIHKSGRWKNKTITQIAADLCQPYGVTVAADTDVGKPFAIFKLQPGESVFEALDRAAKERGVLLTTNAKAECVITKASETFTGITITDADVLTGERSGRFTDRYSVYVVKGQSNGTDTYFGDDAARKYASITDANVTTYRPLLIISEAAGGKPEFEKRARWERNVRTGRSRMVRYQLQGWRAPNKDLWLPNMLVNVSDKVLRVEGQMLVTSSSLAYSEQGTIAEINLMFPSAFDVYAEPVQKKSRSGGIDEWAED